MQTPLYKHWKVDKHILRYLKGTMSYIHGLHLQQAKKYAFGDSIFNSLQFSQFFLSFSSLLLDFFQKENGELINYCNDLP